MNIDQHVASLLDQLEAAAATGSPKVREAAAQLMPALAPAARLAIVEALSEAAGEISRELEPGSVDVRLRGKDVEFVVTPPDGVVAAADAALDRAQAQSASVDSDAARTTLRIPDELKRRAERAAAAEGSSLNAWLVQAVSLHLEPGPRSRRGRAAARFAGWADQQD